MAIEMLFGRTARTHPHASLVAQHALTCIIGSVRCHCLFSIKVLITGANIWSLALSQAKLWQCTVQTLLGHFLLIVISSATGELRVVLSTKNDCKLTRRATDIDCSVQ